MKPAPGVGHVGYLAKSILSATVSESEREEKHNF